MRIDDGGGGGPYTDVDVESLAEAGTLLATWSGDLAGVLETVRTQALNGLDALPESDLRSSYAFCWGRWSQQLEDGAVALGLAGGVARGAAGAYASTDHGLTGN